MEIDIRMAFELLMAGACGVMGWFMRLLFDRLRAIEEALGKETAALAELRVYIPTNYVSKSDFKDMGDNIFNALRRIEDKLDNKADKQ